MNRKIAVFATAAVLAGGAGIAVAAGGDSASTGSQPSMSRPDGGPGGGPGGGFDLSALAEALGVSESRLQEAMEAARPADGQRPDMPPGGTTPPSDDQGAPPAGDDSLS